jgi:predicted TPR repeat methyltransferase
MVAALRTAAGGADTAWDVLDLGCGTGLVGAEIAPLSRRLVGIDLSPNMIERARSRGIYGELHCVDIMTALTAAAARYARYHVVAAADVFIYVGKLDEVILAIQQVLHPGGLFAFSVEAAEGTDRPAPEGYRLGLTGRYTHQLDYLQRLARLHGFGIEEIRQTRIRVEQRRPVQGWLSVWRSGAALRPNHASDAGSRAIASPVPSVLDALRP